MRLVDKDWLLQRLNLFKDTKYDRYFLLNTKSAFLLGIKSAKNIIEDAETVELIKCKDCRYREEDHRCQLIGLLTRDYDFCSYAERKDGKNEQQE